MNIDYLLLKKQREDLINHLYKKKELTNEIIEGLINLCDGLLDDAEEKGLISDTFYCGDAKSIKVNGIFSYQADNKQLAIDEINYVISSFPRYEDFKDFTVKVIREVNAESSEYPDDMIYFLDFVIDCKAHISDIKEYLENLGPISIEELNIKEIV